MAMIRCPRCNVTHFSADTAECKQWLEEHVATQHTDKAQPTKP
jgi:hypothetical protein